MSSTSSRNCSRDTAGIPFTTRFGVAPCSKYRILCSVASRSPCMSRIAGVSHDIPRPVISGSGSGAQCATSPGSRMCGSPTPMPLFAYT